MIGCMDNVQNDHLIDYVDYVAADIKLQSATGMINAFEKHDKFFAISRKANHFAKNIAFFVILC